MKEYNLKIPKVIHYCWFGEKELPLSAQKCIESWKKYMPEFEVKQWDESNFDLKICDYVSEAYKCKKWAFVSDYARFYVLYKYGGVYFDTDVELIKKLELILDKGPYMGCEIGESQDVNPGLGLAAYPKMKIYKEILDYYNQLHFDINHVETVVMHTTKILRTRGYLGNGEIEHIDGVNIYPPQYFAPMNQYNGKINISKETHSIHHYTASWFSNYFRIKRKIQRLLGKRITGVIIAFKNRIRGKI